MYLTAHRVRSGRDPGQTGINAILYLHDMPGSHIDWARPDVARIADAEPGRVAILDNQLTPGGNRVISFLDIVAADGMGRSEILDALDAFIPALATVHRLPHTFQLGRVAVRFGCQRGIEAARMEEWAALRDRAIRLLNLWEEQSRGAGDTKNAPR